MKLLLRVVVAVLVGVNSLGAYAQTPAQHLKSMLAPIKTLQANFKQTTTSETAEFIAIASGTVKIVRPGQFYWQVNQPGKQIIVINHSKLWLYDVDLQQVTIKKLDASALALNPASLLSGDIDELLAKNEVTATPASSAPQTSTSRGLSAGSIAFTLTPKQPGGTTKWIKLFFKGKQLTSLQFANQLAQQTTIQFRQMKINKPVSEKIFTIQFPKGTDVIKQ
jgi:outer membrane lipoprotein carrier protein